MSDRIKSKSKVHVVHVFTLPGTWSCPRRRRKTEVRPDHISEN